MNKTRIQLALVAMAALTSGCSSTRNNEEPVSKTRDGADDSDLRMILMMRKREEINDRQAVRLIAGLRGIQLADQPEPKQDAPAAPAAPAEREAPAPARQPSPLTGVSEKIAERVSLRPYKPGVQVTGRLRSAGSDSMDRIMEEWAKGFSAYQPKLRVSHEGKGSSTAIPALLENRSDIGPMSRLLKKEEIAQFEAKFGYAPTQIRAAVDALAIYVHPENPILQKGLTLKQLDSVFSSTNKRGGDRALTWGDLGLTGEWAGAPVRTFSRNSASGTYGFFRDEVMLKGDFREGTRYFSGSADLVAAVSEDKFAIGYSGIGYKNSTVATVRIAASANSAFKEPVESAAISGEYPVTRNLFVTLNRAPGQPASDMHREFIAYILSPEGQEAVRREGYFALPPKEVPAELLKLL